MAVIKKLYGVTDEKVKTGIGWKDKTAWDFIEDRDIILFDSWVPELKGRWNNKELQRNLGRIIFLAGGLPYMYDKAEMLRKLMYDALKLKKGDKILLIGEAIDACGFLEEVEKRLQGEGEIIAYEIIDEVRYQKPHGPEGQYLGIWPFTEYYQKYPDEYFDVIFTPQGTAHELDWKESSKEALRILKKGGRIILPEVTIGKIPFILARDSDLQIHQMIRKIQGIQLGPRPQPDPDELEEIFADSLVNMGAFEWKGAILFYGTKK